MDEMNQRSLKMKPKLLLILLFWTALGLRGYESSTVGPRTYRGYRRLNGEKIPIKGNESYTVGPRTNRGYRGTNEKIPIEGNESNTVGPKTFRGYRGINEEKIPINVIESYTVGPKTYRGNVHLNDEKIPTNVNETNTVGPKTFRGNRHYNGEKIPIDGNEDNKSIPSNVQDPDKDVLAVNASTIDYLNSSISTKLIPAIYIIVIIIGIPSNVLILRMLYSRVRMVCTAIFYTNLAIADLLFCLMLPFKVAYHLQGNNWIFGELMCRVITICFYGNMYCSILLLTCISVSRYVAIVHPFIYRSLPKRTYAILLCVFVWIAVFMFMIPLLTKRQTYRLEGLDNVCCNDVLENSIDKFQFYYFISMAIFGYLIPFAAITFCYFSIIRTLGTNDQKLFTYMKITILLLLIFSLCFTPSNIILIIHQVNYYYHNKDVLYGSYLIALCFSSLNSCLDPFLYFFMSEVTKPSKKYSIVNKGSNETTM